MQPAANLSLLPILQKNLSFSRKRLFCPKRTKNQLVSQTCILRVQRNILTTFCFEKIISLEILSPFEQKLLGSFGEYVSGSDVETAFYVTSEIFLRKIFLEEKVHFQKSL